MSKTIKKFQGKSYRDNGLPNKKKSNKKRIQNKIKMKETEDDLKYYLDVHFHNKQILEDANF